MPSAEDLKERRKILQMLLLTGQLAVALGVPPLDTAEPPLDDLDTVEKYVLVAALDLHNDEALMTQLKREAKDLESGKPTSDSWYAPILGNALKCLPAFESGYNALKEKYARWCRVLVENGRTPPPEGIDVFSLVQAPKRG